MKAPKITTLWEVVASLQDRLEGFGLEDEVVDAAVVCGVESMLDARQAPVTRRVPAPRRSFLGLAPPLPAKA
jgi:hypothetical protein